MEVGTDASGASADGGATNDDRLNIPRLVSPLAHTTAGEWQTLQAAGPRAARIPPVHPDPCSTAPDTRPYLRTGTNRNSGPRGGPHTPTAGAVRPNSRPPGWTRLAFCSAGTISVSARRSRRFFTARYADSSSHRPPYKRPTAPAPRTSAWAAVGAAAAAEAAGGGEQPPRRRAPERPAAGPAAVQGAVRAEFRFDVGLGLGRGKFVGGWPCSGNMFASFTNVACGKQDLLRFNM